MHDFVYVCLFSYHTVLSDSISGTSSADSVGILAVTKLLWYLMNTALGSVQPVKEEIVLSWTRISLKSIEEPAADMT